MTVVVVGMRVAVDEVPTRRERGPIEHGGSSVTAEALIGHAGVEHRNERRSMAAGQQGRVAGRIDGGEVPGLGIGRAADQDPIRFDRRNR